MWTNKLQFGKKSLRVLTICLSLVASGEAQMNPISLGHLQYSGRGLGIKYTPFGSVQVLDNRLDTGQIYIVQTGEYPPGRVVFDTIASAAIGGYLEDIMHHTRHDEETLLVDIDQLGISNRRRIPRVWHPNQKHILGVIRRDSVLNYDLRKNILLTANIYYKSGEGHYRKLFTIHKEYYYVDYPYVRSTITYLLNELLSAASLAYSRDTEMKLSSSKRLIQLMSDPRVVSYQGEGEDLSMDRINIKVSNKWAGYPIVAGTPCGSGRFRTFDDFRNGRVIPGEIKVRLIRNDSTYTIYSGGRPDSLEDLRDWAVCDSGNYYVRIFSNIYLPLNRRETGFVFYVPWTLPDMYALLSLEENAANQPSNSSHSGSLILDLSAQALESLIQISSVKAGAKRIVADGLRHGYRYCAVDMDSGDFLYRENPNQ